METALVLAASFLTHFVWEQLMGHPWEALHLHMKLHAQVCPLWLDHNHITSLPFDAKTRGIKRTPHCASKRINGISPIWSQLFRTDQSLGDCIVLLGSLLPPLPPAGNPIERSWSLNQVNPGKLKVKSLPAERRMPKMSISITLQQK